MSSGLRRPATRDPHTKYFLIAQNYTVIDKEIRSPKAGATITSQMTETDFSNATNAFAGVYLPPNPTTSPQTTIPKGLLKDLGSVVYIYDQLGQPNSNIKFTYRLVQYMAGADLPTIYSEGAYGASSNFYNTFWICTQICSNEFITVPFSRMG
jgi:hypothetical protein